jgi:multidrug transporter EmrE-like cation transporter
MLFLLLAVLCSLTISATIKLFELRGANTQVVIASNDITAFFLTESLKASVFADLSAVAYALYSAATATLIFGMGPAIWRERVTRGNLVGVLVALGAIVLLNLR